MKPKPDKILKILEEEKMKRDLWDAMHKCSKCDAVMKRKEMTIEGEKIRGWECAKCDETVLHPQDAQRMLLLSKLRRGISVKIGELGKSLVVRIPKEVASLYNLSKGEQVTIKAESESKIELELST